jgi:hypothetical protein
MQSVVPASLPELCSAKRSSQDAVQDAGIPCPDSPATGCHRRCRSFTMQQIHPSNRRSDACDLRPQPPLGICDFPPDSEGKLTESTQFAQRQPPVCYLTSRKANKKLALAWHICLLRTIITKSIYHLINGLDDHLQIISKSSPNHAPSIELERRLPHSATDKQGIERPQ